MRIEGFLLKKIAILEIGFQSWRNRKYKLEVNFKKRDTTNILFEEPNNHFVSMIAPDCAVSYFINE